MEPHPKQMRAIYAKLGVQSRAGLMKGLAP
jgi:DNA-binding CsgD family transcriptional regulator